MWFPIRFSMLPDEIQNYYINADYINEVYIHKTERSYMVIKSWITEYWEYCDSDQLYHIKI
jgi:hypothetical protein